MIQQQNISDLWQRTCWAHQTAFMERDLIFPRIPMEREILLFYQKCCKLCIVILYKHSLEPCVCLDSVLRELSQYKSIDYFWKKEIFSHAHLKYILRWCFIFSSLFFFPSVCFFFLLFRLFLLLMVWFPLCPRVLFFNHCLRLFFSELSLLSSFGLSFPGLKKKKKKISFSCSRLLACKG